MEQRCRYLQLYLLQLETIYVNNFNIILLVNRSDHKYEAFSGYACFWNHIIDAVSYKDDNLNVTKITNAHVLPILQNREPIKRVACSNVI